MPFGGRWGRYDVSDDDDLIERVAERLRQPVSLDPGFDGRVMAAIRDEGRARSLGQSWSWLTRPRTVRLAPLTGLGLAAAFAGLVVLGTLRWGTGGGAPDAISSPAPTGMQVVQFVVTVPNASSVSLVGDFNDWDPGTTQLTSGTGGVWSVTVPLRPGRYQYAFVVDGTRWVADPAAPPAMSADDFGSPNSVVTVGVSST
jgi:hypothetical protein